MKKIAILTALVFLVNILAPFLFAIPAYAAGKSIQYYKDLPETHKYHIQGNVPEMSTNGKAFNDKWWLAEDYRVIVYGSETDWPKTEEYYRKNTELGTYEWRYLGYDNKGNPFSNDRFPNDATSGKPMGDKNWIKYPWDVLHFVPTEYSWRNDYAPDINRMKDQNKWSPEHNTADYFGYGNVQSYPTLDARGSFRMWHEDSKGKIWYDTQYIPVKPKKLEVPLKVTTEILSNDFVIEEGASTIDVSVRVTAELIDEPYYSDELKKVLYYNRDDIKTWYIKLKYLNYNDSNKAALYKEISPQKGSNIASYTFNFKISRDEIAGSSMRVIFDGIGRVKFKNDHTLINNHSLDRTITVLGAVSAANPNPVPVEYPPDISIAAPEKANVKENYTVEVKPIVPAGETIQSVTLESSFNGGTYTTVSLSSLKATQNYATQGTVNYRSTVRISNGKTAQATATTQIVDERPADAKADVFLPEHEAYEGHYINVYNRAKIYFDGNTYNAKEADELGLANSGFHVYDNSEEYLDSDLYDTKDKDPLDEMKVKFNEVGTYKVSNWVNPVRGEEDEDVEAVVVKPCPHIIAYLLGSRKDDRKLTLDFSQTVINPDYPLVSGKTYVKIEDINSGESVTVTNSSHPDSTNIKTRVLTGNVLDFLIKAPTQKTFKATIYVEDIRGTSDTEVINFIINPDLPPVAEVTASLVQYRDSSGTAKVRIGKTGKSNDGDILKVNDLKYKVDTNNNGSFDDEVLNNLSTSLTDLEAIITTDKVGKIQLDYTVQEDLTPETLPEFVTASDYLSGHRTMVIDVDNLQPHTSLRAIKSRTVDQLLIGNSTDASTLSTKADAMKTSLNGLENPIDLSNSVKGVKISDKIIEQNITISNGEDFKSLLAANGTHYAYITNLGNLYIREYSTGIQKKRESGWPAVYGLFGASAGDWLVITYNTKYFIYNTKTGVTLSGTLAKGGEPVYNENTQLVSLGNACLFDTVGGYLITLSQDIASSVMYREGNKAYAVVQDSGYALKEINLSTGNITVVSTYSGSMHDIKYYPEYKKALILQDNSGSFRVTACDFQNKNFYAFGNYSFNTSYVETLDDGSAGGTYTFRTVMQFAFDADLSTNRCYIWFTSIYRRQVSSSQYRYYYLDKLIGGGTSTSVQKITYEEYSGSDTEWDDDYHGSGVNFICYKGKVLQLTYMSAVIRVERPKLTWYVSISPRM